MERLAAWLFLAAATVFAQGAAEFLQRGIEETSKGQYAKASIDLQAAMKVDAGNAEVYFRLGLLFGRMTDFPDAETAFRHAILLKPGYAEAYYNLGLTQIANPQDKLDWPTAMASFRSALRYRPSYSEAANYLGVGLAATGDLDGSIEMFEKATQLNGGLAEAHFNLGLALERKGKREEAESEYRRAEALRASYPDARVALGKLLFHELKLTDAEHELTAALRENPDLSDAHYILALVYQSEKKASAAGIEFDQVRDLAKRKTDSVRSSRLTNEGLQSAENGDMAAALRLEHEAVELKPDFGLPHYNLALILADTGDLDGASHELVKAASLMQASPAPWFDLGRVLSRRKDYQGSLAALSWAACLAPSDARISAELREVRTQAHAELSSTALNNPPLGPASDSAASHLAFAADLSAAGDRLGAVGELLRVLDLEPANQKARVELSATYEEMKLIAKAALEKAKADLLARP